VTSSTVPSVALNVATPLELVTTDPVVYVDCVPPFGEIEIDLPEMGLSLASIKVTVMVETERPLAFTRLGLATTVDVDDDAGPGPVGENAPLVADLRLPVRTGAAVRV